MIARLIDASLANRPLVLLAALLLAAAGVVALRSTPVDAIPDLSDVQVIIRTAYPGQAPEVVEQQVTYPLSTALLAVPGATAVRGFSFYGDSFVYVVFEDGTDLYWARARVLEYLDQAKGRLPPEAKPALGPDATGVGWVYQYALVDRTGGHDLAELRSLQDWFLADELRAVPGVAEIATVGGMVRQYQVVPDPAALAAHRIPIQRLAEALRRGNAETGAGVLELAEAEYLVRATGYLDSVDAIEAVPLDAGPDGVPLRVGDVAEVRLGPAPRRGIAELDGEGEVVGAIVVMRYGANAKRTIERVEARLEELAASLPEGVEVVETYDRSGLIDRAVATLREKLVEESIVVVVVCLLFLAHFRSSLVILLSLPLAILVAFLVMRLQGLNADIMALGGIAIAIGAMVDAAIVLVENLHRRMQAPDYDPARHWDSVRAATREVGPALFFALLVITISFLPVFALEAQEGRLFRPLAFTKTYAMAAAAGLSVTLVPVLAGYLVRGRIRPEEANPLNRALTAAYRPVLAGVLRAPRATLLTVVLVLGAGLWPATRLGSEFMPELDEGDLMYMPTTLPGLSIGKAQELLQRTDQLIASLPEVDQVFGKIGRADTATDPAPLTMIETVIRLKPRSAWRPGMTIDALRAELERLVDLPGVTNAWVWPIKTRIDMQATGSKTPVGIKITGPELGTIQRLGAEVEAILADLPGTRSAFAERVEGGRYLTIDVDRAAAARFGLDVADVHGVIRFAIGGANVTETIEGLARYPVNVRYPRGYRDTPETLRELPIVTPAGALVPLGDVATIAVEGGPPMIRSENARRAGWVYVDVAGSDLGGYVAEARRRVAEALELPPGYALTWSGQYEYLARARARLALLVPLTGVLILTLLYLTFRRLAESLLILAMLPLSLAGGLWLLWALGYAWSVAVAVGFIALAGVAAETGVIMLVYLRGAWQPRVDAARAAGRELTHAELVDAIEEGALRRLRPKVMTVATILAGLLPILVATGTGAEVMRRIAAPMVGGMASALLLTLVAVPAAFYLLERARLGR